MSREELTPFEKLLYDDGYTSKKPAGVYDVDCYICGDPDFARMGLPLCRSCPECERVGRGPGHIAADGVECSFCGYCEDDGFALWSWLENERGDTVKLLGEVRRDGRATKTQERADYMERAQGGHDRDIS